MTYNKQQLISFINKMCWTFKIKPGDKAGHLISRRWEGPWDVGEYADSLIFFFSLVSDNLITISSQENKNEFAHTEPTIPAVLCWSPEAPFQGRLRILPLYLTSLLPQQLLLSCYPPGCSLTLSRPHMTTRQKSWIFCLLRSEGEENGKVTQGTSWEMGHGWAPENKWCRFRTRISPGLSKWKKFAWRHAQMEKPEAVSRTKRLSRCCPLATNLHVLQSLVLSLWR